MKGDLGPKRVNTGSLELIAIYYDPIWPLLTFIWSVKLILTKLTKFDPTDNVPHGPNMTPFDLHYVKLT